MPWLYYGLLTNQDATTIMKSSLKIKVSTYPSLSNNQFQFFLSVYDFAGNFKGFELLSDQLILCSVPLDKSDVFATAGSSVSFSCSINLYYHMRKFSQTYFYDLCIIFFHFIHLSERLLMICRYFG